MIDSNHLVGLITVALGGVMFVSAWRNQAFLFELTIPRLLDRSLGRRLARVLMLILAIGFVVAGVGIAMKWLGEQ